jgi:hypothetical protein
MLAFAAALVWLAAGLQAQPPGPATLVELDVSRAAAQWTVNQDMADLEAAGDRARFRTVGGDPILIYRPAFQIKANAWQVIEIPMKADRDGLMQIFWSGTKEGAYGGFSGEKSSSLGVVGDGKWRTYRVYPFWQAEGQIIQMRLDPYDATRFEMGAVRIVQLPMGASAGPAVGSGAAWTLRQGVDAEAGRSGATLRVAEPEAFALAPITPADSETLPYVCLRLTSSKTSRAALVYASDKVNGLREVSVKLTPDGKPHVYNVDVMSQPGWAGRIVGLGVRPGTVVGDAVTVHSIAPAALPAGAADLRIAWFGAEQALPRSGRDVPLTARVGNAGGAEAKGVSARLTLPAGVSASRTAAAPKQAIGFDEDATWRWSLRFPRPGSYRVGLTVGGPGAPAVSTTTQVQVTAAPVVARTGVMPAPTPVRPKQIDVGIYYFPGWRSAGQWAPIMRFPERRPVLGWYREGDPSVADWQVKWAVEHGVTFFAYDWYWSQGSRSLEHGLHDGLFKSKYGKQIKFCLLWANHNAEGTSSYADMQKVTRYWIDNYFKRPEHYTIDGKPVMIIFTPHRFRADMGSPEVKRAFTEMRRMCVAAGLKGLYMIACVGGSPGEAKVAEEEGYDAITAYNWPGLGLRGSEKWASFDDLLEPYRKQWDVAVSQCSIPIMTPVSGGWDSRPWHGDAALVRYGRNPANFERHLRDAKAFIEANPKKALPVTLIEAWNELGEGSYVEPQQEFGFGYLDAIRRVFTEAPEKHTDLTPADVGAVTPEVDVLAGTGGVWDLSKDIGGWESGMDITKAELTDGALTVRSTGRDPAFFGPPVQVRATTRRSVTIRMKLTGKAGAQSDDTLQVFWSTRSAGTSEEASVRAPSKVDGQWHTYALPVGKNQRWRGVITSLRIDACNKPEVKIQISRIAITR